MQPIIGVAIFIAGFATGITFMSLGLKSMYKEGKIVKGNNDKEKGTSVN